MDVRGRVPATARRGRRLGTTATAVAACSQRRSVTLELILWRHAEAEEDTPDLGRKLTSRGKKHGRRVAEWLHTQLPDSARILVSRSVRAQQTASELIDMSDRTSRTVDALAPDAGARVVLAGAAV